MVSRTPPRVLGARVTGVIFFSPTVGAEIAVLSVLVADPTADQGILVGPQGEKE